MLKWLKQTALGYAGEKAAKDARQYVEYLEAGRSEEIGSLLIAAVCARMELEDDARDGNNETRVIVDALRSGCVEGELSLSMIHLARIIKSNQQAGQSASANTFMPWLHTLRFYGYPKEMYVPARKLWKELRRGLPEIPRILKDRAGRLPDTEMQQIASRVYELPPGIDVD